MPRSDVRAFISLEINKCWYSEMARHLTKSCGVGLCLSCLPNTKSLLVGEEVSEYVMTASMSECHAAKKCGP
jgi:hypothetical protein